MAFSTITHLDVASHQRKSAELKTRLLGSESTTYVTGPTGHGNGEVVLLLGGTGYIGRAVVPELVRRGYTPVVLARSESAKGEAEFEGADVVIGDPTRRGDVQRAVTQTRPRAGKLYKKLAPVAFYLEAAKYWSVVDHVAPAYGTRTLRGFMEKLKDRDFPTGSFRERMKSGTNVMPTDI